MRNLQNRVLAGLGALLLVVGSLFADSAPMVQGQTPESLTSRALALLLSNPVALEQSLDQGMDQAALAQNLYQVTWGTADLRVHLGKSLPGIKFVGTPATARASDGATTVRLNFEMAWQGADFDANLTLGAPITINLFGKITTIVCTKACGKGTSSAIQSTATGAVVFTVNARQDQVSATVLNSQVQSSFSIHLRSGSTTVDGTSDLTPIWNNACVKSLVQQLFADVSNAAAGLLVPNVGGDWVAQENDGHGHLGDVTLSLQQNGTAVTGKVHIPDGFGRTLDVTSGSLSQQGGVTILTLATEFEFDRFSSVNGAGPTLTAVVTGDRISKGVFAGETLSARRVPDLAGKWAFATHNNFSQVSHQTVFLSQRGFRVTGRIDLDSVHSDITGSQFSYDSGHDHVIVNLQAGGSGSLTGIITDPTINGTFDDRTSGGTWLANRVK